MPGPNRLASVIDPASSFIRLGAGIFGGIQGMNTLGDLIRQRNDAAAMMRDIISANSMPLGAPWGVYSTGYGNLLDTIQGFNAGGFGVDPIRMNFTVNRDRIDDFYRNLPGYSQTNYSNPFFDYYYMPATSGIASNLNSGSDFALGNLHGYGANPYTDAIFGQVMSNMSSPYMQTPMDIANYLLTSGGSTRQNQDALGLGLYNIRNGGFSPQFAGMFDFGGRAADAGFGALGQALGLGQNLMNPAMNTQAQGLMDFGMGNLLRFANNSNPEMFLGPRGSLAIDSMQNSPYIGQTFRNAQNYLFDATRNGGYTPQDSFAFNQALPRGFSEFDYRNFQLDQDRNRILGNYVNPDYLPEWYQTLANIALGPQGIGGFSGGGIDISGGGGGGSVSAPTISRDTGPIDPELKARIDKAFAIFDNNPLMSTDKAVQLARNKALSDAKALFRQGMQRAVQLGGEGPLVAGGGAANQALFENEDAALEAMSRATTEARLGQQGLALQRAGQGAQLASVLQQLAADRERMFMQANIADAENQMRAASINAQLADSAASRSLQAQSLNAQNALAQAQLRSGMIQSLLNSATNLRNQNMDSNLGSLQLLPQIQSIANNRMGMMFDTANQAANRANQRFGLGAGAFSPLVSSAGQDIDRYSAIINPLVAGQNTATNRAGLFSGFPTAALSSFDNRINTGAGMFGSAAGNLFSGGAGLLGAAGNLANTRMGIGSDLFARGDRSEIDRMTLGGSINNNLWGNLANMMNIGNTAGNNALSFASNMGGLVGNYANIGSNMWGNVVANHRGFGNDNQNQQNINLNAHRLWNDMDTGLMTNMYYPYWSGVNNTNNNIMSSAMSYMLGANNLWNPYMSMMGLGSAPPNYLNIGGR